MTAKHQQKDAGGGRAGKFSMCPPGLAFFWIPYICHRIILTSVAYLSSTQSSSVRARGHPSSMHVTTPFSWFFFRICKVFWENHFSQAGKRNMELNRVFFLENTSPDTGSTLPAGHANWIPERARLVFSVLGRHWQDEMDCNRPLSFTW